MPCECYSCGTRDSGLARATRATRATRAIRVSNSISHINYLRVREEIAAFREPDYVLEALPSPIHGIGCFTTTAFLRGDHISMCLGGILLSSAFDQTVECRSMTWENPDGADSCYCMQYSDHASRFVNSSMQPNTVMCWDVVRMVPRLVAKRRINAGDELTVRYPLYMTEDAAPASPPTHPTPPTNATSFGAIFAKWRASRVPLNNAQLRNAVVCYVSDIGME